MKKIFRPTLNALVDDYAAGNLTKRDNSQASNYQRLQKVFVQNNTGRNINVGDVMFINGLMRELPYDDLVSEYLTSGFCLSGVAYDPDYPNRTPAVALEPISANGIGECNIPGIVAANIDGCNSAKGYANVSQSTGRFEASESEGPFAILGSSGQGDGGYFSYLVSHPVTGHRCWFINEGRWPISAGELVGITGMADSSLSTAEAVENWQRDGLRLRVKRIGLIDDANAAWLARGVALENIGTGQVGRGFVWDCFVALIWRDPEVIGESRRFLERADWTTTEWTDPDGVNRDIRRLSFVKYPGDFTCVDAAAPNEYDEVFSLVIPAPGGPSLDRIKSVDVSSNTAVMACGVTASSPLASLRESDADKSALLTRDSVTRRWHILVKRDGTS